MTKSELVRILAPALDDLGLRDGLYWYESSGHLVSGVRLVCALKKSAKPWIVLEPQVMEYFHGHPDLVPEGYILWDNDLFDASATEWGIVALPIPHLRLGHAFFPPEYADILGGLAKPYTHLLAHASCGLASARPEDRVVREFIPAPTYLLCRAYMNGWRETAILATATAEALGFVGPCDDFPGAEAIFNRALLEVL